MDRNVQLRFDESEKRYVALEKRFDDIKWYFGGAATFFTLWFAVLTVVFSSNFNSQKEDLRDFQTNLKSELGKLQISPDIELDGLDNATLSGQDLMTKINSDKPGEETLDMQFVVRNKSAGGTGPMWIKLYTGDSIQLEAISTDEPKFKYEGWIVPADLNPSELPGKFSIEHFLHWNLHNAKDLKPGRYPARIKVFFGQGQVTQSDVTLVVGAAK